ncbi:adenine deaminase, partial [Nguyenibacter vanlangensis]|nr:adenine deaminase [Nguyenibacter vanlangensis]
MPITRLTVPPLHAVTRDLAATAGGGRAPDLVITGARILSTYSDRILSDREIWIAHGRIAAVKPAGSWRRLTAAPAQLYVARG